MPARTIVAVILTAAATAACTRPSPGSGPGPGPAAAACPDASQVALAAWSPPDDDSFGGAAYGHPAEGHWGIRLGHRADDDSVPFGPLTPDQVGAMGLSPVTGPVWIVRPGQAPCPARVGEHVAERVDAGGEPSTMVSAITRDCAPSDTGTWASGWAVQAARLDGCRLVVPAEVGRVEGRERDTGFYLPANPAPLPEPWARAIDPAKCEPGCVTLWSVDEVPGQPAVSEATVTRIVPGEPEDACNWDSETSFQQFLRGADGVARPLTLPADPERSWEAEMSLAGVLAEGEVPRVLLFTDTAAWATYDLAADGTLRGHRVAYFIPHEEDFTYRSLAPYCGP